MRCTLYQGFSCRASRPIDPARTRLIFFSSCSFSSSCLPAARQRPKPLATSTTYTPTHPTRPSPYIHIYSAALTSNATDTMPSSPAVTLSPGLIGPTPSGVPLGSVSRWGRVCVSHTRTRKSARETARRIRKIHTSIGCPLNSPSPPTPNPFTHLPKNPHPSK